MKKILVFLLAVLCAVTMFTGCKKDEKVVRIGTVDYVDDVGMMNDNARIAQSNGYFAEELKKIGYEPKFIKCDWTSGTGQNEAFAAGELDVIVSDQVSQLILKGTGLDIRAIAVNNNGIPNGVTVQANSGIKTVKDLEGKKLVVPTGSSAMYFQQLVEKYDLDTSGMTIYTQPSDVMNLFFYAQKDAADAVVYGLYTSYYMELNQVPCTTIESTEAHPEWATQSFVSGLDSYWKANPEIAKALIRALARAQSYAEETAKTDADAVFAAMSKDDMQAKVNKRLYSFDLSFSYFNPQITGNVKNKLSDTCAFMLKNGLLQQSVTVENFIDTSYYDAIEW